MMDIISKFLSDNWGNIASALGFIISVVTLLRVNSINRAQEQERRILGQVLDFEDLYISMEETFFILDVILNGEHEIPADIIRLLSQRLNSTARTAEKFKGALQAVNTLRGDKIGIPESHLNKGIDLFNKKAYEEAIKEFDKAIEFYKGIPSLTEEEDLVKAYYYSAMCYFEKGDLNIVKHPLTLAVRHCKSAKSSGFKILIGDLIKRLERAELKRDNPALADIAQFLL